MMLDAPQRCRQCFLPKTPGCQPFYFIAKVIRENHCSSVGGHQCAERHERDLVQIILIPASEDVIAKPAIQRVIAYILRYL